MSEENLFGELGNLKLFGQKVMKNMMNKRYFKKYKEIILKIK